MKREVDEKLAEQYLLYEISEAEKKLEDARLKLRKCFEKKKNLLEEYKVKTGNMLTNTIIHSQNIYKD